MKIFISVLTCVIGMNFLFSQGSYESLDLPYSIRTQTLGGVAISDISGVDASSMNPATISGESRMLSLSVMRYPAEIQTEFVEWRYPTKKRTYSISLRHLGYGIFDERDGGGAKTGQFSAGDTWISISAAQNLTTKLRVGVTTGIFYSQIHDASALLGVATAGAILKIEKFNTTAGMSFKNAGLTLDSYTNYNEHLPSSWNIGFSRRLAYLPLTLHVDGSYWPNNRRNVVRVGGEFVLPKHFYLRIGTTSYRFDLDTKQIWESYLANTAIGLGIDIDDILIDAGFGYQGALGSVFGVGISSK